MKSTLWLLALLFLSFNAIAHTWEIRVNQAADGTLTWYLQSYHPPAEAACMTNFSSSGLTINGVDYPIQSIANGDITTLSNNVVGANYNCSAGGFVVGSVPASQSRQQYGIIVTPFLGTTLNIEPYSNVQCWDNCGINAVANFTPPPPPSCTTCPITGITAVAGTPSNNGTPCNLSDDYVPITVTVAHQACATATGDGKFSIQFGSTTYGPISYTAGPGSNTMTINAPVGTGANPMVTASDADFGANGCSASTTATMAAFNGVGTLPTVSIPGLTTYCQQNTIYDGYGPTSLTYTAAASGGTTPYTYKWTPPASNTFTPNASYTVSAAGTYTVTVKDANGCLASATVGVAVKSVRCGNNNNKVQICHNTGSNSNPTNALCISPNAVPSHMAEHGDCLGDCSSAFGKSIGVTKLNLEGGVIEVFPNPAHGKINVALKESGSAYRSYQITDINGRVVSSKQLTGDVHADLITIDISGFARGIYIIRAVTDDGASLSKFVVE